MSLGGDAAAPDWLWTALILLRTAVDRLRTVLDRVRTALDWLVDQCLGGVGGHFGDERRGARDPDSVDDVLGGDVAAGGALGAQRHGAAGQHAAEQVAKRGRVVQLYLVHPAGQCEPGRLPGEPQRHRHPAGERGRGDVQGLAAALRLLFTRGDLDDESACRHAGTLACPGRPRKVGRPGAGAAGTQAPVMAEPSPVLAAGEGSYHGPAAEGRPL